MEFPCGPVWLGPQAASAGALVQPIVGGTKNPHALQCGPNQKGWKRKGGKRVRDEQRAGVKPQR